MAAGAEAQAFCAVYGTTEEAAERGAPDHAKLAGAEARRLFAALFGPAEAVPLLQSMSRWNFSASCEAVP
jgi:hypothetical protein